MRSSLHDDLPGCRFEVVDRASCNPKTFGSSKYYYLVSYSQSATVEHVSLQCALTTLTLPQKTRKSGGIFEGGCIICLHYFDIADTGVTLGNRKFLI